MENWNKNRKNPKIIFMDAGPCILDKGKGINF